MVKDSSCGSSIGPASRTKSTAATDMFEQLEHEHAKLVAELDGYEKELAPKLAEREIDRQNRIAGLQTELEAYREIAKLRRPRAEQERQERIAKAQAAIARIRQEADGQAARVGSGAKDARRAGIRSKPLEMGATYNARVRAAGGWLDLRRRRQGARARIASWRRFRSIKSRAFASMRWPTIGLPNRGPGPQRRRQLRRHGICRPLAAGRRAR